MSVSCEQGALWWLEQGATVLLLRRYMKEPKGGQTWTTSTDPADVRHWFGGPAVAGSETGYGVVCGVPLTTDPERCFVAFDVDTYKGQSLDHPPTTVQHTPRGGAHAIFTKPIGLRLAGDGSVDTVKGGDGKGYVVGAGSRIAVDGSGEVRSYTWPEGGPHTPSPLPAEFVERFGKRAPVPRVRAPERPRTALPEAVQRALGRQTDDRSADVMHLVAEATRAGLTESEIVALAETYPPAVDKYGERLEAEILRCMDKVEPVPEPPEDDPWPPEDPWEDRARCSHGSPASACDPPLRLCATCRLSRSGLSIAPGDRVELATPAGRRSLWVDLTPFLDGTYTPPEPTVGAYRRDGVQLLYPRRWHSGVGLNAAGKSWFGCVMAVAVLDAGGTVVYVHFEEFDPSGTIDRLRKLGAKDDAMRERFCWPDRDSPITPQRFTAALAERTPPSLVVLDGILAACSSHGWPPNDPDTVGKYRATYVTPAVRCDAAVLSLGHPPKAKDRQDERHTFGSTAWTDEIDGVAFQLKVSPAHPIVPGAHGWSALYSVKDRYGGVARHGVPADEKLPGFTYLGALHVDDTSPEFQAWISKPEAPEDDGLSGHQQAPYRALADEVWAHLREHGEVSSTAFLQARLRACDVAFRDEDLDTALQFLVMNGLVETVDGRRGAKGYRLTSSATSSQDREDGPP